MRLNIRHLLFIDRGIFYYLALSGKGSQSCLEKGKGPGILLMLIIFQKDYVQVFSRLR